MIKRLLALLFCLGLLATGVLAGDSSDDQKLTPDQRYQSACEKRLNQMALMVDLWHGAVLSGESKEADQHLKRIFALVENDIEASKQIALDRNSKRFGTDYGPANDRNPAGLAAANIEQAKAAQQRRDRVMVKQRLYNSMLRSDAFSNRYRLVGDYMGMMKKQLGLQPIQVAEEVPEDE